MKNRLKYLFILTVPATVLLSFQGGLWSFTALIYSFGIIPLLELIFSGTKENLTKDKEVEILDDKWFDLIVWLVVPLQYFLVFTFCTLLATTTFSWWELIGITCSMGVVCGGLGINVAHELGHRRTWYEQAMSLSLLLTSQYMHFFIDHNRIHHKHVSTPNDPTSSRKNEALYPFLVRSISGNWLASFKLAKLETLLYLAIQILFLAAIFTIFGKVAAIGMFFASVFGILELESVNYIEHYGLARKINPETGRYEKVQPKHSWNSNHAVGRITLFELSRHSDHHANAQRKYQTLRHFDDSPQMPTGYPGMMLLSTIPPLWFKVMNPLVETELEKAGFS